MCATVDNYAISTKARADASWICFEESGGRNDDREVAIEEPSGEKDTFWAFAIMDSGDGKGEQFSGSGKDSWLCSGEVRMLKLTLQPFQTALAQGRKMGMAEDLLLQRLAWLLSKMRKSRMRRRDEVCQEIPNEANCAKD